MYQIIIVNSIFAPYSVSIFEEQIESWGWLVRIMAKYMKYMMLCMIYHELLTALNLKIYIKKLNPLLDEMKRTHKPPP